MIEARAFEPTQAQAWDELAAAAPMATFLHTRRFLGYHGDRFDDASLVLVDGKRMIAVLPAAIDPGEPSLVISHPGATFGGIVHDGSLGGERMIEALRAIAGAYRSRGLATLVYRAVPRIYHRAPCDDDLYALFRLGARRPRVDLSCAIDLEARRPPSSRRQRSLKKALDGGVELSDDQGLLPEFWRLLAANLEHRHQATPVHTEAEIARLLELFPAQIRLSFALLEGELIGGAVLFESPRIRHVQYNAAGPTARHVAALDLLFTRAIEAAAADRLRYFDFGISTEAAGLELNAGLYDYKFEFGGGGVLHEVFELDLAAGA